MYVVWAAGERAANESVEDATSQVKIKEAFSTPDNLQNCLSFLRTYAADRKARCSCVVVPAEQIAYPQVTQHCAQCHAGIPPPTRSAQESYCIFLGLPHDAHISRWERRK